MKKIILIALILFGCSSAYAGDDIRNVKVNVHVHNLSGIYSLKVEKETEPEIKNGNLTDKIEATGSTSLIIAYDVNIPKGAAIKFGVKITGKNMQGKVVSYGEGGQTLNNNEDSTDIYVEMKEKGRLL